MVRGEVGISGDDKTAKFTLRSTDGTALPETEASKITEPPVPGAIIPTSQEMVLDRESR
ncbi:MAG: hypothetical protein Q8P44_03585 [Dehalococcoidia bacterium]|nr:hypothetical protein [Dehalococcoidia bacterium]